MKATICKSCEAYEYCSQSDFKDYSGINLPIMSYVSKRTMYYYSITNMKVQLPYETYIDIPYKITILLAHMRNEFNVIQEKKMRDKQK